MKPRFAFAGALGLAPPARPWGHPQSPGVEPSIIQTMADDLGVGALGYYGPKLIPPRTDRMAEEGTRLTQYRAGAPIGARRQSPSWPDTAKRSKEKAPK